MKVLALSTSTPRGSAAVLEGDRVLGAASYEDLAAHAERLFSAIDEALRAAGVARNAIEQLACDVGPGSFTGVRVAVSAAKGIALALGARVVPVASLEAMAFARRSEDAGLLQDGASGLELLFKTRAVILIDVLAGAAG